MVQSAEADPEVSEDEVKRLKEELERELERLASGEVAASRKPPKAARSDPGTRHIRRAARS